VCKKHGLRAAAKNPYVVAGLNLLFHLKWYA
jgi:hypothetical protein